MKSQKGITIISLIITIIVMVILAGIALAFSVGENGVITKAEETKTVQSTSEELERVSLAILNAKTSNLSSLNGDPEFDEALIKQVIEKEFGVGMCEVIKKSDYFVVTIKDTNNKYKVTVDGKVEKMTINDENQEPTVDDDSTSETSIALTLNSNVDSIFTTEYYNIFLGDIIATGNNKAKLVYNSEGKSIIITNKRFDTLASTALIIVEYYENDQLKESYTLRGKSSIFGPTGTPINGPSNLCSGRDHYPMGWTDHRIASICEQKIQNMGGTTIYKDNIFGILPEIEYPKFYGEWEIDIANSDNYGKTYLSNVLVLVNN